MKRFILIVLSLTMLCVPASAQRKAPTCTDFLNLIPPGCTPAVGAAGSPLAKPFQELATFIASDSDSAIALSTQLPALQDGNGQQCWMAMKSFGDVLKAHPVPLTLKLQTDLEAYRLLTMAANNLCANAHCTVVFSDLNNAVQAAGLGVTPIPSLTSLCAKIPLLPVVAPVAASSATSTPSTTSTTAK